MKLSRKLASLPFPYGLRIPAYDRVNGVTLPWAPFIQLDSGATGALLVIV